MRWGVRAWNMLLCYYSWWLFGFSYVDLLPAILVAVLLMIFCCLFRMVPPAELWGRIPTKKQIKAALPPREKIEDRLELAWKYIVFAGVSLQEASVFMKEEVQVLQGVGGTAYVESAKRRWAERGSMYSQPILEEDFDDEPKERKKPKGVASKIAKLVAERKAQEEAAAEVGGGGQEGGGDTEASGGGGKKASKNSSANPKGSAKARGKKK